ncbi:MBL fold metallo-hydrolase [bacterium]|nr:MBL fold metallo-hydrolase [bacterium]
MKIRFIGTASGLAVKDRYSSSLLLTSGGQRWLLDCGEGCVYSLLKQNVPADKIDGAIITHTHPDHCSGLPMLMQNMHLLKRANDFQVYLPYGVKEAFQNFLHHLYLINDALTFNYVLLEYEAGEIFHEKDLKFSAVPNKHLEKYQPIKAEYGISINCFSLVIQEADKTIYYSADIADIDDLYAPPDTTLLIVESTHIQPVSVMKYASDRGIKRVAFTHIPPDMDTDSLKMDVVFGEFADDGLEIEI